MQNKILGLEWKDSIRIDSVHYIYEAVFAVSKFHFSPAEVVHDA